MLALRIPVLGWHASGDVALELLHVGEVGTRRTPLVGAWSRWGWHHPGPALSYVLAPSTWLLGPPGALLAVLVVNASSLVGATIVVLRRAGHGPFVLTSAASVLLTSAMGAERLMSPWNPWAVLLPLFLLLVLGWAILDGSRAPIPLAVAVAGAIVQTHVGFLPVVTGVTVAVVGTLVARTARRDPTCRAVDRRILSIAAATAVVVWLPPIVDQLTGSPGNLAQLASFAAAPGEPTAGFAAAWDVAAVELASPGGWSARPGLAASAIAVAVVAGLIAIVTIDRARPDHAPSRSRALAIVALGAVLAGFVGTSRTTGPLFDYVLRWWWVVAVTVWLVLAWAVHDRAPRHVRRATIATVAAATAVASLAICVRSVGTTGPDGRDADAIGSLSEQAADVLDDEGSYLLDWVDGRRWGGAGMGLYLELERQGYDVRVPADHELWFDEWHLADGSVPRTTVRLVGDDDLVMGYAVPPSATLVAAFDSLSAPERARSSELWSRALAEADAGERIAIGHFDSDLGRYALESRGVSGETIAELSELRRTATAYRLYVLDRSGPDLTDRPAHAGADLGPTPVSAP